jgi:hypothetical protein
METKLGRYVHVKTQQPLRDACVMTLASQLVDEVGLLLDANLSIGNMLLGQFELRSERRHVGLILR